MEEREFLRSHRFSVRVDATPVHNVMSVTATQSGNITRVEIRCALMKVKFDAGPVGTPSPTNFAEYKESHSLRITPLDGKGREILWWTFLDARIVEHELFSFDSEDDGVLTETVIFESNHVT